MDVVSDPGSHSRDTEVPPPHTYRRHLGTCTSYFSSPVYPPNILAGCQEDGKLPILAPDSACGVSTSALPLRALCIIWVPIWISAHKEGRTRNGKWYMLLKWPAYGSCFLSIRHAYEAVETVALTVQLRQRLGGPTPSYD